MQVEEWEIWHTYTTFLQGAGRPFEETAEFLIESGIADCVYLNDGRTYWKSNADVAKGITHLGPTSKLVADIKTDKAIEGFAAEAWAQACHFARASDRVLGTAGRLTPAYLRAYLGKISLNGMTNDNVEFELSLYPILIAYETGVFILEFRMIGPEAPLALEDFIETSVNLYNSRFHKVRVSPGISSFATKVYYAVNTAPNLFGRVKLVWLQGSHDLAVRQQTVVEKDEPFPFELAPLSSTEPETLRTLAISLSYVVAFSLSRRSTALHFILFGRKPLLDIGEYWSSHPYIYLVRFENQATTASENEKLHGADFGRILVRTAVASDARARLELPKNARMFEDYGAYIGSACTLFAWSAEGLSLRGKTHDPNRGDLIYQRQLLAETLEYGYMLHRGLYHQAERLQTSYHVVKVRRQLLKLRLIMDEASQSGEVRDLLNEGWTRLGLPKLISDIKEALLLQEDVNRSREAMRTTRVGWALTSIFGFLAVPALADQIIDPLWKLHPIYRNANPLIVKLEANGIALVLVVLITAFVLLIVSRD